MVVNMTVEKNPPGAARERSRSAQGLTRIPRALLALFLFLFAFLLADTVYLLLNRLADWMNIPFFAAGRTALPVVYQVLLLAHSGVGLLAAFVVIVFTIWHLPGVWRRRHRRAIVSGIALIIGWCLLAGTGLFVLTEAASRQNAWIWWIHVIVGPIVILGYLGHRYYSSTAPNPARYRRFAWATGVLACILVLGHAVSEKGEVLTPEAKSAIAEGLPQGPGGTLRDIPAFAAEYRSPGEPEFVPAAFVPPDSPFFPSAMTTSSGSTFPLRMLIPEGKPPTEDLLEDIARYGFVVSEKIGAENCARCHPDIVEQWSHSAHRFASFNNPFYEATINDMRENSLEPNPWIEEHMKAHGLDPAKTGMAKSQWCAGCHDHALIMTGKMEKPVDRASAEAQAGLMCLACHLIDGVHNITGNSRFNIADTTEDPYIFKDYESELGAYLHDTLVKAKPEVHKRRMLKPFFRSSEYCSACHKVNLDVSVNNYRWLRGQDEYDNWHDSGVALNAARTFYLPGAVRICADCHMPPEPAPLGDVSARNGTVRSHRFLAVNSGLPFVRGDTETIERMEEFLRAGKLRVDVFALRREGEDEPVMALDRTRPLLVEGERAEIDVVVRNLGVGHTFPGGTIDSNEGWLEVSFLDEDGNLLLTHGIIGADGHLDPEAHMYKGLLVDRNSQPIHKRNAQDIYAPIFVRLIGPGTANIGHYTFTVPEGLAGQDITIRARLLWRKFDRIYTEFSYSKNPQGFRRFDQAPDLPITEIAENEVALHVITPGEERPEIVQVAVPDEWQRFNDYGIGLFLENDTKGAGRAFTVVRGLQPERVDGERNLARVAIRDGDLENAFEHLAECEKLKPADAQTAWVWGVALQEDGRYAEAAQAYRRVLEVFPDDRATWLNLGRTLYLNGGYAEALNALGEVLVIDPENRSAFYHRMLCFRALGEEEAAEVARVAYEKYQIDETAQQVTRRFRMEHPAANYQSQARPVHELHPVITLPGGTAQAGGESPAE
jgi:tetratricopeptide (TPR) repeat protein